MGQISWRDALKDPREREPASITEAIAANDVVRLSLCKEPGKG